MSYQQSLKLRLFAKGGWRLVDLALGGIFAAFLFVYLVYGLLKAENF